MKCLFLHENQSSQAHSLFGPTCVVSRLKIVYIYSNYQNTTLKNTPRVNDDRITCFGIILTAVTHFYICYASMHVKIHAPYVYSSLVP